MLDDRVEEVAARSAACPAGGPACRSARAGPCRSRPTRPPPAGRRARGPGPRPFAQRYPDRTFSGKAPAPRRPIDAVVTAPSTFAPGLVTPSWRRVAWPQRFRPVPRPMRTPRTSRASDTRSRSTGGCTSSARSPPRSATSRPRRASSRCSSSASPRSAARSSGRSRWSRSGQFIVALVFAEVSSHFPLAGSVFQWTKYLSRSKPLRLVLGLDLPVGRRADRRGRRRDAPADADPDAQRHRHRHERGQPDQPEVGRRRHAAW